MKIINSMKKTFHLSKALQVVMFMAAFVLSMGVFAVQAQETKAPGTVQASFFDSEEAQGNLYADSDALLRGYTGFWDSGSETSIDALYSSSYNGNKLSGLTAVVYDRVKSLAENVAAGYATSTSLDIELSEYELTDYYWSAQDLGVSSLYGDASETSVNSDAAKIAIDSVLNTGLAVKSVIRDCPYELFWFSNKYTISRKYTPYVKKDPYTGEPYMGLRSVSISISMGVAPDYRDESDGQGYTTDWYRINAIQNAVANAQSIISNAYWMSDYEKLDYYMQQICDYATYDYSVSTATYPGGYGNPWQMIYVFDADPNTAVVCEGYAKAFQYLCDQTYFSGNTYVYSVSGDFQIGNGGYEGHLWNIIHISGQNYLADITNCDANGFSKDLFMASPYSGSVDAGYSFTKNGSSYSYYYSADARMLYSDYELYLAGAGSASGTDADGRIVLDRVLSYGMTGNDVLAVQQRLYDLGYLSAAPDGVFGNMTWEAVNNFQIMNGLGYSDGMVGNWTAGKLNADPVPYNSGQESAAQNDPAVPDSSQNSGDSSGQLVLSRVLSYGMTGDDVLAVQERLYDLGYLSATPDGVFGNMTWDAVNSFQIMNGLGYSDGMVGNWTVGKLNGNPVAYHGQSDDNTAGNSNDFDESFVLDRILSYGMIGDDVLKIQQILYDLGYLEVWPDGVFGWYTQDAVVRFQDDYGIYADGLVGNVTLNAMTNGN